MRAADPLKNSQQTPHDAMSAGMNTERRYQRGLSKQMMKLNRYSASGSTQRKGITATSWHILFVVASRSTEAQAGNSSHNRRLTVEGGGLRGSNFSFPFSVFGFRASNCPPSPAAFQSFMAHKPQLTAYT